MSKDIAREASGSVAVGEKRSPAFTAWVLWGALLSSHALYTGLVLFAAPPAQEGPLVLPLTALAVVEGTGALGAYFLLVSDQRIRGWLQEQKRAGKSAAEAQAVALARLQPLSVLAWAIAESVTLAGLALAFLGQLPFQRFLLFVLGGVAVHLCCLPRVGRVAPLCREVYGS